MQSKIIRIVILFILALSALTLPVFLSQETSYPVEASTPTPTASPTPVITSVPTPTPTASPLPTPSPSPTPEPIPGLDVVTYYRNQLPEGLHVDLKYDEYDTPMDYIVALGYVRVREAPDEDSTRLLTIKFGSRLKLHEKVIGVDGESHWYRVSYTKKGKEIIGFVAENSRYVKVRSFNVDKMLDHVLKLHQDTEGKDTVYIDNFRSHNGWPPRLPGRKSTDEFGYIREQATAGYVYPGKDATFRYIPDGMLAVRLYEGHDYTQVYIPSFDYKCWGPNRNVSSKETEIANLKQVVVVDRAHQNCGVFEHNGEEWVLISLSYITTGKPGEFSLVTPLGDFMAIERKTKFSYTEDGTDIIVGYAPYVIRFCGGGYLHGVPMNYPDRNNLTIFDLEGREGLSSLGTIPKSHMCVRNYTSHAKFLYKWVDIGSAAVIIME